MIDAERHLLQDKNVSNFAKSWIIFSSFGLQIPEMRSRIKSGFKPWNSPAGESEQWTLNLGFCSRDMWDKFSEMEASHEWAEFMEFWNARTLKLKDFEITSDNNKDNLQNLVVFSNKDTTQNNIRNSFDGFIEPISKELFEFLRSIGFQYIYCYWNFIDEADFPGKKSELLYGFIFGPLSLIEIRNDAELHVTNINSSASWSDFPKILEWQTKYKYGFDDLHRVC